MSFESFGFLKDAKFPIVNVKTSLQNYIFEELIAHSVSGEI